MVRKISVEVFDFNELKKSVQEKVIRKEREDSLEFSLNDSMNSFIDDSDFVEEEFKKHNLTIQKVDDKNNLNTIWSLNYSSYPYVVFDGVIVFKNYTYELKESNGRQLIIDVWSETKNKNNKDYGIVRDELKNISLSILESLKAQEKYLLSDEYLKEEIENNDYVFLEDGTLANNLVEESNKKIMEQVSFN